MKSSSGDHLIKRGRTRVSSLVALAPNGSEQDATPSTHPPSPLGEERPLMWTDRRIVYLSGHKTSLY
jgi:hypothetical protein